jgi:hypothetical protein
MKYGDDVEVRDFEHKPWKKGYKFLVHDQLSTNEECSYLVSDGGRYHCFKYFRPARPDLEIDAKVWVRSSDYYSWKPAHFAEWNDDGRVFCWAHGRTSHTAAQKLLWNSYRLTPPEDE